MGLSSAKKDFVLKSFQGKFNSKSMLSCGLFVDTKYGYIDRFRNRIMFSLFNITGKVIGFAGRAIDKNENAKYINSPETQVYNKSKTLYGLHLTKNEIAKLIVGFPPGIITILSGSTSALYKFFIFRLTAKRHSIIPLGNE